MNRSERESARGRGHLAAKKQRRSERESARGRGHLAAKEAWKGRPKDVKTQAKEAMGMRGAKPARGVSTHQGGGQTRGCGPNTV